jgi:hypothetical protein
MKKYCYSGGWQRRTNIMWMLQLVARCKIRELCIMRNISQSNPDGQVVHLFSHW